MLRLGEIGVPTHFVRRLNMREQLAREGRDHSAGDRHRIRNVVAGSLSKRFGMPEGAAAALDRRYYTSRTSSAIRCAWKSISPPSAGRRPRTSTEDLAMSLRINDFLLGLFLGVGLRLVAKLEFGRLYENEEMHIVLADEISPDNCRLWDTKTGRSWTRTGFAAISAMSRRPIGK